MQQFLVRQPSFPDEEPTDKYYLKVANRLLDLTVGSHLLDTVPDGVVQKAVLTVVGYYQDVISDSGAWHAFIDECRRLYGRTLPFFSHGDEYIDYELNLEDVRFIAWYALAMCYEDWRLLSPEAKVVEQLAQLWYDELARLYDDAPEPDGHRIKDELEINNPEDAQSLMKLGNWLFLHCYLMTPAFGLTLMQILSEPGIAAPENITKLHERLEQAMMEDPTGPLALYLREWLYLLVEGHMPPEPKPESDAGEAAEHKYYSRFVAATGGETIAFFNDYASLNRFFVDALGWEAGEEHLPQLKGSTGFVLMVNRTKGMLLAKDVAGCIAAPGNPYYDRAYASEHAIELLTERGRCPADLLQRVCRSGWLPDAVFPGEYDSEEARARAHKLVADNWDFVARCYLQQYYRGD